MQIDALTVSVNYADYLSWALPVHKRLFEHLLVVTSTADKETQELCAKEGVGCLVTDAFYADGQPFSKSAAINEALERLDSQDWACIVDADVLLPAHFRETLQRIEIDPKCIYGVDRMMCKSFAEWEKSIPVVAESSRSHLQPSTSEYTSGRLFPLGERFTPLARGGYIPLGYFQLWNPKVSGFTRYPQYSKANSSDAKFAMNWPRRDRQLLPEIIAVHLESSEGPMGRNWAGRRTGRFGVKFLTTEELAFADQR